MSDIYSFSRQISEVALNQQPSGKFRTQLRMEVQKEDAGFGSVKEQIESLEESYNLVAVILDGTEDKTRDVQFTGTFGNIANLLAKFYGVEQ